MKVLYWVYTFLPDIGGIQTLSARLMPVLNEDHELLMIAAQGQIEAPDEDCFSGIPVYRFPILQAISKNDLPAVIRIRKAIQELIHTFQPDIIHLHPSGPELLFFLQIDRVMSVPTLVTVHNNHGAHDVSLSGDTGFGKALRNAAWVTAVSHNSLAWVLGEVPSLKTRSSVVHNGIPAQALEPQPLPWDPLTLLYAGRLNPQKNLDVLLDAFALVLANFPSTRLVIVGDGVERESLVSQAGSLGISANVDFIGKVEPEAVPALINQSTIFVMSSIYEGLPMVALEAAQMGRPIVATRVGGLPEAVHHERTGLLTEPQNPTALAGAVQVLLSDPQRAAAYGAAGRELVNQQFSIEACAAAYDQIYHSILSSSMEVSIAEPAH